MVTPSCRIMGRVSCCLDCAGTDSCKIRMTAVGVYTVTVTSVGYDGNTYSGSIDITVLDRAKLDALLQTKWSGMKAALAKGDVEGAVAYFAESSKESYRQQFAVLSTQLPQIVADMGQFRIVRVREFLAEYDLRALRNGRTYSFQVLFMLDYDGTWKVRSY